MTPHGNLFVISGPSGSGKSTLASLLPQYVNNAWVSVSATTRAMRPGEQHGVSYYFVTRDEFEQFIAEGKMLEYAQYNGNYYGTPLKYVQEHLEANYQVILEIEYQGAMQVKKHFPDAHLMFVQPPSLEVLRNRLVGRATDAPEVIEQRMNNAELELSHKMEYDVQFVNDSLEQCLHEVLAYVVTFDGVSLK